MCIIRSMYDMSYVYVFVLHYYVLYVRVCFMLMYDVMCVIDSCITLCRAFVVIINIIYVVSHVYVVVLV